MALNSLEILYSLLEILYSLLEILYSLLEILESLPILKPEIFKAMYDISHILVTNP